MSRSKRQKTNKIGLKIWLPIICLIVVAVTFFMIHDMENKIEEKSMQNTEDEPENIVEDESENVIEENTVENEVTNESVIDNTTGNVVSNKVSSNTSQNVQTTSEPSAEAKPAVTDQKQKAIELVKKMWGQDDTVSYSFEYINENGEYVVAVKDKASATVKNYFRVNLETEEVELD